MGELSNPKKNNNLHFTYSLRRIIRTTDFAYVCKARADVVYNERRRSRGVKSEHLLSHPPKFTSQICNHFLVYVVHIPPSITLPLPLPLNGLFFLKKVKKSRSIYALRSSRRNSNVFGSPFYFCFRERPFFHDHAL